MTLLADTNGAQVHHCAWDALPVEECDTLITDCPYSAKTQGGHDVGVVDLDRRSLSYPPWTPDDVRRFVEAWHPRVKGWIVSVTDDQLAPAWSAALEAAGRYCFAWLPYVAPGSRVRLLGDGPSAWTCWIVVARPRTREMAKWGTLPGAYLLPPGQAHSMPVVGGKPIWLGAALVRDYSRPGDLIVDPCCGAGTFGVAAIREGRRAIMGDLTREHADLAARWIANPWKPAPDLDGDDRNRPQRSLFP